MSGIQLIVGQDRWGVPADEVDDVAKQVQQAMTDGTFAELGLIDAAGRRVKVWVNSRAAATVVLDIGEDPRPSEFAS